jgi:16S rRNA (uracil1498-N3)-methyltransferase
LTDGAELSVTDGAGRVVDAVLSGTGARPVGPVRVSPPPSPRLVLAQALSKGRRAEDAVRVACELGVDRLVPVLAARTQGRPHGSTGEGIVARWDAVAVAALEQSRGVWRARVDAPVPVARLGAEAPGTLRLVTVPGATPLPDAIGAALAAGWPTDVVVAVGPEGGWTPEEVGTLTASGWIGVGLGPSVLRTEHAGPVAVSVLAALLGRWGSPPASDGASDGVSVGVPVGGTTGDARLKALPSRSPGTL